jgi:twinkle protein
MEVKEIESGEMFIVDVPKSDYSQIKISCPVCSGTHSPAKQRNKDLSFNLESKIGKCHRCGKSFVKPSRKPQEKKNYIKPEWKNSTALDENVIKYLEERKISQATIRWNKLVSSGMEYIAGKQSLTIQFNYWKNGELVNVKYRDAAKNFKLIKDAELVFFNIDSIKDQNTAIVTEGEIDCLSLIEAGYKSVVSVPNGAGASLDFLENCIDDFNSVEKIILATDQDIPGIKLRDELARRFGIERCFRVDFGECKDANEYHKVYGIERLREVIDSAEPFPLEGIFSCNDVSGELESIYQHGLQRGETLGIPAFDKLLSWNPGFLYTFTGIPGHGKSEILDFFLVRLNIFRRWKIGYFSPENQPIELHIIKLIEKITGKKCNSESLKRSEFDEALRHISDDFFFISPELDFTIDSILSKASALVARKGINALVIDPYNRLEHQIPIGMSETHYISSFLDKLIAFARRKNIALILVAHPIKMKQDGIKFAVPNLYDIAGSANFYNKTDFGIAVYRDITEQITNVIVQKVRFRHLGEVGSCSWKYNLMNGRYEVATGFEIHWDNISYLKRKNENNQPTDLELQYDVTTDPPF